MNTALRTLFLLLLSAAAWGIPAEEVDESFEPGQFIVTCPITGMIDDGVSVVVERAVDEAEEAAALFFRIDTPGGRVDSAIDINKAIMSADCPTIAYIEGMGAISAGALISYSCDYIIMSEATNIGASTPIQMGAEPSQAVTEKSMSFIRSRYRALGEAKGHNPLLGEAMVDSDIRLVGARNEDGTYIIYKIRDGQIVDKAKAVAKTPGQAAPKVDPEDTDKPDEVARRTNKHFAGLSSVLAQLPEEAVPDPLKRLLEDQEDEDASADEAPLDMRPSDLPDDVDLICAEGKLLTLTGKEAEKYGLIPKTVAGFDEAVEYSGYPELKRHEIVPTFAEELFAWLTSPIISSLLLMCGLGGIYLEVRTPGFGLPGIIGASCLAIFFGANLVIGLADWFDILLVLVGVALLIAELFFIPGFGIAGISGMICIIIGLYMSLTRVPIPEYSWDYQRIEEAGLTLIYTFLLLTAFVAATWKLLPRTPFLKWILLTDIQSLEQDYVVQTEEQEESLIGKRGVTTSMLRPGGRGRIDGKLYSLMTRGEFIDSGKPVEVIRVEGNRYVVRELPEEEPATEPENKESA